MNTRPLETLRLSEEVYRDLNHLVEQRRELERLSNLIDWRALLRGSGRIGAASNGVTMPTQLNSMMGQLELAEAA